MFGILFDHFPSKKDRFRSTIVQKMLRLFSASFVVHQTSTKLFFGKIASTISALRVEVPKPVAFWFQSGLFKVVLETNDQ